MKITYKSKIIKMEPHQEFFIKTLVKINQEKKQQKLIEKEQERIHEDQNHARTRDILESIRSHIYGLEAQNRDLKKEIKKLNEKLDRQKFDIISAVTKKIDRHFYELKPLSIDSDEPENKRFMYLDEYLQQPATEEDLKLIDPVNTPEEIFINGRFRKLINENGFYKYYTSFKNNEPINEKILTKENIIKDKFRYGWKIFPASRDRLLILDKYEIFASS